MANMLATSYTDFTGMSTVIDRASGTLFVHLSNRVHLPRKWSNNHNARETLGALGSDSGVVSLGTHVVV